MSIIFFITPKHIPTCRKTVSLFELIQPWFSQAVSLNDGVKFIKQVTDWFRWQLSQRRKIYTKRHLIKLPKNFTHKKGMSFHSHQLSYWFLVLINPLIAITPAGSALMLFGSFSCWISNCNWCLVVEPTWLPSSNHSNPVFTERKMKLKD